MRDIQRPEITDEKKELVIDKILEGEGACDIMFSTGLNVKELTAIRDEIYMVNGANKYPIGADERAHQKTFNALASLDEVRTIINSLKVNDQVYVVNRKKKWRGKIIQVTECAIYVKGQHNTTCISIPDLVTDAISIRKIGRG